MSASACKITPTTPEKTASAAAFKASVEAALAADDVKSLTALAPDGGDLGALANLPIQKPGGLVPVLLVAIFSKAEACASALLSSSTCDVNATDAVYGRTALHYAPYLLPKIVPALLARAANPNIRDKFMDTPLHTAGEHNCSLLVLWQLVQGGAKIQAKALKKVTPLHRAAQFDRRVTAHAYILLHADLLARDSRGETPLHYAARSNAHEMARLLLRGGADLVARNDDGNTALCVARKNDLFHVTLAMEAALDPKKWWDSQDDLLVSAPVIVAALRCGTRLSNDETHARLPTEVGGVVVGTLSWHSTPARVQVWFHIFGFIQGKDCYAHTEELAKGVVPDL